ncbi:MAG: CoA-binding protein [Planctomycetes bacterium]|nr:CoA-binding protein [Planctomycetota bacterium]
MDTYQAIEEFLAGEAFAVVGASTNREKYGNKVLRCYAQHGRTVFPINPTASEVEGLKAYKNLASLPAPVHGVSIITPPAVTRQVVEEAREAGIRHIWMQPGAESKEAVARCRELGMNVIGDGSCLLAVLGFRE